MVFFLLCIYYHLNIYYRDQDFTPDKSTRAKQFEQNNLKLTQV